MIPVSFPKISKREIDYVTEAVSSGWVSSLGPYIDKFEKEFANFCGTKYALTVSNGTLGLHLALKAFGIGEGDEVIIPDLTFIATANAVRYTGAKPVMVDVFKDTFCINPSEVIKAITPRTRAIIPVHLYGNPSDMLAINDIAKKYNLRVIEDAAEAHGASIDNIKVGAFGDCGVFSFYGNKIITSGEGGMITTNNQDLYDNAKFLRDHAMSKDQRYWHTEIGYNYRMTNIQAALGVAQLEQIEEFIICRNDILNEYNNFLESRKIICNVSQFGVPVAWMICVVIDGLERKNRDLIILHMKKLGVDSRPFFYPVSMMPMYKDNCNPVSYGLSESGFNLPIFVGMKPSQVRKVCEAFLDGLDKYGIKA